ncbi:MAG: carboxypeptidase regulatory-like domain-containing protein [Candidatus Rokubacteria bacterium]|nr:carboxypeptidase regulatory-like domain-containing protein [Candidatus Rokubacteria bacterium]MBI3825177.1 carboxypeptidase regulatory-like domain-containing protein [Candidatus Rokubacteria bacterium]
MGALLSVVALPAGAGAYEVASVADGGSLSGVVRFAAPPPRLPQMPAARGVEACDEARQAEALVLGPGGGVRGGVVLVEGVARGKKPGGEAVLDAQRCVFVAHVTATTAGARMLVKNGDAVLHHPRGLAGRTTVFDLALPHRHDTIDVGRRLTRPGVVRVLCGAHPHMSAWLVVHDSPYVAVTDERGAYTIDGIPPGRYRVTLWHEGYRARGADREGRPRWEEPRTVTRAVTIAPHGSARLDFELR